MFLLFDWLLVFDSLGSWGQSFLLLVPPSSRFWKQIGLDYDLLVHGKGIGSFLGYVWPDQISLLFLDFFQSIDSKEFPFTLRLASCCFLIFGWNSYMGCFPHRAIEIEL
jgi:hypothetical protein